jgi:hypothetical protein
MNLRPHRLACALLAGLVPVGALAAPIQVLFVGNSYTFGRVDPVMSYNAANVTDLTRPERGAPFDNLEGSNEFEPHPWGGIAGIFKQLTVQAGLDYAVSLSTRNAASLRGHMLNTNPADWDLRGNIALEPWDKVVLQEQSDEVLPRQTNAAGNTLASNPEFTHFFADIIEDFVHSSDATGMIRYRNAFPGANNAARTAACVAATGLSAGSCNLDRGSYTDPNANPNAEVYLYQTWARPNLVDGAFVTETDEITGAVTRLADLSQNTQYASLEEMTADLVAGYAQTVTQAAADGTAGFAGVAPVGEAFLRAVQDGLATRDFWAPDAQTDGLIDLWFDDGTHASKYGSYLSALVMFGTLTGKNPSLFGVNEVSARDLGIDGRDAVALQRVAALQLNMDPVEVAPVPLPATAPLAALGLALLAAVARRRSRKA